MALIYRRLPSPNGTNREGLFYKPTCPREIALDARYDDERKDPENTNNREARMQGLRPDAPAANKPKEFAVGALKNSYASEPAEDDDLDELPDEVVEGLLAHAKESGCSEEMLEKLHMRLRGKQAEDDEPPAFPGQPRVGDGQTRAMDAKLAMDWKAKMARMSRHDRDQFIRKNPKLVASLQAYDGAATKSFAQRWPEVARMKICY